jgi:hypothetical protein
MVPLRMSVSKVFHDYLGLLKRKTILGSSENDIAKYLLIQRLEQMIKDKYHETEVVPKDTD